jgi:4-hydroxybenzoate polyprenyltransferase
VCGSASLAAAASKLTSVELHVVPRRPSLGTVLRAMRLHQWAKNLLVFLPFLPLAATLPVGVWLQGVLGFLAFGLCASSVYLVNDLFDLEADRAHPRKRFRPIAAGDLGLGPAIVLAVALLGAGFALSALLLPPLFLAVLALYWALTTAYSLDLKRRVNVDVLALACLYTLRVLAGSAVLAVAPSFWMLAFSIFLFLSLAAAKRMAELDALARKGKQDAAAGRGYVVRDIPIVLAQGVASGQLAVLVFALYLHTVLDAQFSHPEVLWGVFPLLLLWINRVWMKTSRGEMHDDPVVFALRDRFSLATAAIAVVCVFLAV